MPSVKLSPAVGPRQRSAAPEAPGLVLLKIDGLSYRQMQHALGAGRLPYLGRLIASGAHRLAPFYSGVPSSTPAVQAELFYGVRHSVPGVSFYDRLKDRNFTMLYPGAAGEVGRWLEKQGEPLLRGGCAYSNIYTGGADEARYCTQTMTLRSVRNLASSLKLFAILAVQPLKLLRMLGYGILETALASSDFLRGLAAGKSFTKELKFIPTRVIVCILLRELIRTRVKMDVRRGIRIVHAAFLGYDEQAHRRGPASAFAHWTLRGIDAVIADIHRAARRSGHRHYRLVIYSDHGQEAVVPYRRFAGRTIKDAVRKAVEATGAESCTTESRREDGDAGVRLRRAGGLLRQCVPDEEKKAFADLDAERVRVNAMGPLGHVYFASPPAPGVKRRVAMALVRDQQVPLVLFTENGAVTAVNHRGRYALPADAARVLGADHPLAAAAATDLAQCCRHPLAGDLVLSGWTPVDQPLSFAVENGAHGGPGKEETRAFVLLPKEVDASGDAPLRPENLRQIAIDMIGGLPP
jgi:hypothetical protein